MLLARIVLCLLVLISNQTMAKEVVRVGYLPIMDHLILPVSHALDNQQYQYVDVKPRLFKKWSELIGALNANKLEAAFIMAPSAIDLFDKNQDIRAILLAHRNGTSITVTKNATIKNASELKRKNIGIPGKKATHIALLNTYLKTANLSLKEVNLKSIAPPNMQQAMELGFIDAFIVAEPFGSKAIQSNVGNRLVLTREILPDHIDCIVVIKESFLTQHFKAAQEWITSLVKASEWIEKDRLNTQSRSIANLVGEGLYYPHSKALIINALSEPNEKISFTNLKPNIADFEPILNISKEVGILQHDIDFNRFIDTRLYPTPLQ